MPVGLLLPDVFKNFTNSWLENYALCPSHYLSVPALSWDPILSMTKVELDLVLDVDMYLFFEKCMRGGVSHISKKYSKANNKHLTLFDPKRPTKYITYLEKSNLYDYATSKYLPMGRFNGLILQRNSLDKYNSSRACALAADLEYLNNCIMIIL